MVVADQLAEIQRSLGGIESTVAALKEKLDTESNHTGRFQEDILAKITNALTRIGDLEEEVKVIKLVIEKTVKPLTIGAGNMRQRIIGFMAAMSLIGAAGATILWAIMSLWPVIQRFLHSVI